MLKKERTVKMGERKIIGNTELIPLDELCRITGYKPRTIRLQVHSGNLLAYKFGFGLHFRMTDVEKWLLTKRMFVTGKRSKKKPKPQKG